MCWELSLEELDDMVNAEIDREIDQLASPSEGWSSYATAPSTDCVTATRSMAKELANAGAELSTLIPMADGGISLSFDLGGRSARIELSNDDDDGKVLLVTRSSPEAERVYEELAPHAAAGRVVNFLE